MLVSDGGLYLVDYAGCIGVKYNESGNSPTLADRCVKLRQKAQLMRPLQWPRREAMKP